MINNWYCFRSYTLETSYCGFDQGPLAGFHLNVNHLRNIGDDICKALALIKDSNLTNDNNM